MSHVEAIFMPSPLKTYVPSSGSNGLFRVQWHLPCTTSWYSVALLVSFPCYPMVSSVPPARDLVALLVCPPRDPAASLVSPLRDPAAPTVYIFCVLVMPAAAPAPAPVLRAAEHLFSRLIRLYPDSRRGPDCTTCRFTFTCKRASKGPHWPFVAIPIL